MGVRQAALSLVEAASKADTRDALVRALFGALQRSIGFERACLWSFEGAPSIVFDAASGECGSLASTGCGRLERAGRALPDADVVADFDLQPSAANASTLTFVVRAAGEVRQLLTIQRASAPRYRAHELALARALWPAVSLALRGLSGISPAPASSPPLAACMLTPREREIVELVGRGLQNPEIASVCGTSTYTVRNQLAKVFRKLDVSTRAELVTCAAARGLLSQAVR